MEVQEFTLRDRLGPLTFKGRILADARYGRLDKPRWTDMALYEITDPHSTQRSVKDIERELIKDLSQEDVFRELPRTRRTALFDSMMPHIIPRIVEEQPVYHYVLAYVARSFVYHRADGPCVRDRHRITRVRDVRFTDDDHRWHNLFPCNRCHPEDLEDMNGSDRIAEEKDKHHFDLCTDASDVIARLYRRNGTISDLAAKLLYEARENDPAIARAFKNRRI